MDILTPILLALWDSRRNEEFMYKHGRRLIEESKQYTEEEMEPLKGREIDYMIKALEKDTFLKNVRYSKSRPTSSFGAQDFFMVEKGNGIITVTIGMYVGNQCTMDEIFASRMRYILNFLPFMAEV